MDFENDNKYVSNYRKHYTYENIIDEIMEDVHIINPNFKEKFLTKSKNYLLKCSDISKLIDTFVDMLEEDEKYDFYDVLELKKKVMIYNCGQSYIDGFKDAIELMIEVYGSDYKVELIREEDLRGTINE